MENVPAYSPQPVANWFLQRASIDQMKLHKLVYFAHGWALGLLDRPLINEEIEAWDYGPVVPSLYREFKEFGSRPITRLATEWRSRGLRIEPVEPRIPEDDALTQKLLERVWSIYGSRTGPQLSALTHLPDSPWTTTRSKNEGIRGAGIPNELIKTYFKQQAENAPSQ